MRRLKAIIPIAGILLLILSAASLYVAMRDISKVHPAEDYEDQGVRSFAPYADYPVQVQNTGASGRDRRMNSTETLYMVCYLATDGSGYKWNDEALTRDLGEEIVEAGASGFFRRCSAWTRRRSSSAWNMSGWTKTAFSGR